MTTLLEPATFVLQRRILRPFDHSVRTVANPALFGRRSVLCDGPSGSLVLDSPFRRLLVDPRATWIADGVLATPRGRKIAPVQVEIGPWSAGGDTELLLRPVARSPHLWSNGRLRRYFEAAHGAADSLTELLVHGVPDRDAPLSSKPRGASRTTPQSPLPTPS